MSVGEKHITLQDRGQSLSFVVRTMPPLQREQWLMQALSLTAQAKDTTEEQCLAAGKSLAQGGIWKLMHCAEPEKLQLLSDQLLSCCFHLAENTEQRCTPENLDSFVQDVTTIFTLKNEALRVNLGFLLSENF